MVSSYTVLIAAMAALPSAYGHIAAWPASALDFNGDGYTAATPLAKESFKGWWFHDQIQNEQQGGPTTDLQVGGEVIIPLGCNKEAALGPGPDPCPTDTPSMHAGTPVDSNLVRGCALAIAYKSVYAEVQPADFTVFSVNHDCVTQNKTPFQIPANMPSCENDSCICAWFWQGQASADEMYMTGFRCNVVGGTAGGSLPTASPAKFCPDGGCVEGPKQPLYWANDDSNIEFSGSYEEKPAYDDRWGFADGAQDIGAGSAPANPAPVDDAPADDVPQGDGTDDTPPDVVFDDDEEDLPVTLPVQDLPKPAVKPPTPIGNVTPRPRPQEPKQSQCSWPGHCAGDSCSSYNDCSDDLVCNSGKCGAKVDENYN